MLSVLSGSSSFLNNFTNLQNSHRDFNLKGCVNEGEFMYWFKKLLLIGIAALVSLSLHADDPISELEESHTAFALSLYPTLDVPGGNLVFSPYSVASCLSMVYIGARGDTEAQMQKALHLFIDRKGIGKATAALTQTLMPKNNDPKSYQLYIGNALWVDQGTFLLADFRYAIEEQFKAKLGNLNFVQTALATNTINDWISQQTAGKIPNILNPNDLNQMTRLVLTNAVYFQGLWRQPFDPKATESGPFHPTPDTNVTVNMMKQIGSFPYYENDLMQAAALPFNGLSNSGDNLAFILLLPKSADNFDSMYQELSNSLGDWLSSLKSERVSLKMPKFTLSKRYDLNQPLAKLGMEDAFSSEANFMGIDGMRDLFLNKVIHQAYFVLDEQGVTAAAATAASMSVTALPPEKPPVTLIADHPFLFLIVDLKSQEMLFMGKVAQPGISQ